MGVVILNPQNCLKENFANKGFLKTPSRNSNPNFNRRRKRSPTKNRASPPPRNVEEVEKTNTINNLVMGQVKILKRGEVINTIKENETEKAANQVGLGSVGRIGPDPKMVSKQIRFPVSGFYAGSAFVTSPPPSSVPLPGFFNQEKVNNAAASNIRRILGLNLA